MDSIQALLSKGTKSRHCADGGLFEFRLGVNELLELSQRPGRGHNSLGLQLTSFSLLTFLQELASPLGLALEHVLGKLDEDIPGGTAKGLSELLEKFVGQRNFRLR